MIEKTVIVADSSPLIALAAYGERKNQEALQWLQDDQDCAVMLLDVKMPNR